jgi:hypothetical protein
MQHFTEVTNYVGQIHIVLGVKSYTVAEQQLTSGTYCQVTGKGVNWLSVILICIQLDHYAS